MKKIAIIYLLCLLILAGCGPNEAEIAQMLAQTVDALPTQTSQPTYTPPAVPTPQTVVITPTPASTPMRYDPTDCKAISIPDYSISPDRVWVQREHLKRYEGMCVEMYLQSRDAPNGEPQLFGILDNYVDSFGVELVFSTHTAGMIEIPSAFSQINGILLVPEDPDETVQLVMGEIIEIPANQQPLVGEGIYEVGENAVMYPGIWVSANELTFEEDCAWSRIDAKNGFIKDGDMGPVGTSVMVSAGEKFQTNAACGVWYYITP